MNKIINETDVIEFLFNLRVLNIEYTESFIENWNDLVIAVNHFKFINNFIFPARI